MNKTIIILIALLYPLLPLFCQTNIKELTCIEKISKSERSEGLSINLTLKRPLEKPAFWKIQGDKIILSFPKTYIDPSKMTLQVKSPILKEVKIAQFNPTTVRAVFYGKKPFPDDTELKISCGTENLSYGIFLPYSLPENLNPAKEAAPSEVTKSKNNVNTQEKAEVPPYQKGSTASDAKPAGENPPPEGSTENPVPTPSELDKKGEKEEGLFLDLDKKEGPEIPSLSESLIKAFGSLAIVIALIILTVYLLKKFFFAKGEFKGSDKALKMLSNIYIGDKMRICLVEVLGKVLVLGISGSSINLLTEIEGDKVMDVVSEIKKEGEKPKPFKKYMKNAAEDFDSEKIDSKAKNLSNIIKNIITKDKIT